MKSLAVLVLFSAAFANAGTIIVGTDLPTSAFGTATVAGLGPGFDNGNCCTLAQSLTLNTLFQLNTIVLDLGASDTDQYTVWLTNAVGPSANPSNVLFEATGNFVNNGVLNGTPTSFSTDLRLLPGAYYIVLSSTSLNQQQGWVLADSVVPSAVETLGQNGATGSGGSGSRNAGFAPASTLVFFTGISSTPPRPGFAFQLTGTVIPEPASATLLAIGFAILGMGAKARRPGRLRLLMMARYIGGAIELPLKTANMIVVTIIESITRALRAGDKVEIRGFGTFHTRVRRARTGRNPKTGARVAVPPKRIPYFKASKELNGRANAAPRAEQVPDSLA